MCLKGVSVHTGKIKENRIYLNFAEAGVCRKDSGGAAGG